MMVDGIRNQFGSRVTWNLAQAQSPVVKLQQPCAAVSSQRGYNPALLRLGGSFRASTSTVRRT